MIDDAKVERIYRDALDLFISRKLRKTARRVTLDEVILRIGEHLTTERDTTEMIREMRDRPYDY